MRALKSVSFWIGSRGAGYDIGVASSVVKLLKLAFVETQVFVSELVKIQT